MASLAYRGRAYRPRTILAAKCSKIGAGPKLGLIRTNQGHRNLALAK